MILFTIILTISDDLKLATYSYIRL